MHAVSWVSPLPGGPQCACLTQSAELQHSYPAVHPVLGSCVASWFLWLFSADSQACGDTRPLGSFQSLPQSSILSLHLQWDEVLPTVCQTTGAPDAEARAPARWSPQQVRGAGNYSTIL